MAWVIVMPVSRGDGDLDLVGRWRYLLAPNWTSIQARGVMKSVVCISTKLLKSKKVHE